VLTQQGLEASVRQVRGAAGQTQQAAGTRQLCAPDGWDDASCLLQPNPGVACTYAVQARLCKCVAVVDSLCGAAVLVCAIVMCVCVCLQGLMQLGLPVGSPCVTLDGMERVGLPLKHNGVCIAWQVGAAGAWCRHDSGVG
jgi:hypothetical protein